MSWGHEFRSQSDAMNATFLKRIPKPGNIALVSQSGAICAALVENASAEDVGFSAVVSMGNKVDQTEVEILEMLSLHQQTKVIVTYLEDIHEGHKFINICKQITKINSIKKPVLVLKSGRSARGAKAECHTQVRSWVQTRSTMQR